MLDARTASALNNIFPNSHFKKKVSLEEQKAQKEDRFLRGRQIAFMIYDYIRVSGADEAVLGYADSFSVTRHDGNIQEFGTRWDEVLPSMSKIPSDDVVLESLYKLRMRASVQLKNVLELFDMEIHQKISTPNFQKLKTMVKRSVDQKLRLRNLTPGTGELKQEQRPRTERDRQAPKEEKAPATSGKKKGQCSKGDKCSFRHESNDRAQTPTPNAATPSEPSMTRGRSVSRKRSFKGRSNHGATLRQPCRCDLKGTCTRSPCEYWHPPECQLYKTETGCKAEDKCLFPHDEVDEQPNKKPKKSDHSQKRRERDDKSAVAIVKIVSQMGCASHDSDHRLEQHKSKFHISDVSPAM